MSRSNTESSSSYRLIAKYKVPNSGLTATTGFFYIGWACPENDFVTEAFKIPNGTDIYMNGSANYNFLGSSVPKSFPQPKYTNQQTLYIAGHPSIGGINNLAIILNTNTGVKSNIYSYGIVSIIRDYSKKLVVDNYGISNPTSNDGSQILNPNILINKVVPDLTSCLNEKWVQVNSETDTTQNGTLLTTIDHYYITADSNSVTDERGVVAVIDMNKLSSDPSTQTYNNKAMVRIPWGSLLVMTTPANNALSHFAGLVDGGSLSWVTQSEFRSTLSKDPATWGQCSSMLQLPQAMTLSGLPSYETVPTLLNTFGPLGNRLKARIVPGIAQQKWSPLGAGYANITQNYSKYIDKRIYDMNGSILGAIQRGCIYIYSFDAYINKTAVDCPFIGIQILPVHFSPMIFNRALASIFDNSSVGDSSKYSKTYIWGDTRVYVAPTQTSWPIPNFLDRESLDYSIII